MKIYHNPRCRKSRETLAILHDKGIEPEIILYLDNRMSKKEMKSILDKLGITAFELIRKTEPVFKEQFKERNFNNDNWISVLIKYPKLIERPIVINGDKAIIGRPPENVLELID